MAIARSTHLLRFLQKCLTQLEDRRRHPQAGPGGRREHRLFPERPPAARVVRRLLVVPDRHLVGRDAARRIRLRPQPEALVPATRSDYPAPGVLVLEEVRAAVHVLEFDAE